jgi:general secretion pathway protein E
MCRSWRRLICRIAAQRDQRAGSGKTTTLYTAVAHLNTKARKIVTVEDPVEYNLPGIQQVQVNDAIGLTFARVLRGVLRHDPNVILIGEIRDQETAEIAVRAAQVGRMVLSTLHTSSAAGAVTRLVDLGVPEFIVRDVLKGVLGQELVPIGCDGCGGGGCGLCGGTGVTGRRLRVEMAG